MKVKRSPFYPLISSLGVKMVVNTVNIVKSPPYFQSRREISSMLGVYEMVLLITKKHLGVG